MFFFFFNDTATTEIYTLSLHDALPICRQIEKVIVALGVHDGEVSGEPAWQCLLPGCFGHRRGQRLRNVVSGPCRSEEHTSELQSLAYLVCRLLLEKKKKKTQINNLR